MRQFTKGNSTDTLELIKLLFYFLLERVFMYIETKIIKR